MKQERGPASIDVSVLVMAVIIIVTAMLVVYSKYLWRTEFIELQQLEQVKDQLDEQWGKLLIEQSTWANPARVEQQARRRLHMVVPGSDQTVWIKP